MLHYVRFIIVSQTERPNVIVKSEKEKERKHGG
jgi:hypothetical protein